MYKNRIRLINTTQNDCKAVEPNLMHFKIVTTIERLQNNKKNMIIYNKLLYNMTNDYSFYTVNYYIYIFKYYIE